MRLLARRASTLLAVLALALSARVTEAQSRYIGEADASTIGRRGFSDKRARSVRTRYSGSLSRSNRYRGRDRRRSYARRLLQRLALAPAAAAAPAPGASLGASEDAADPSDPECRTLLEIVDAHPDLTRLSEACSDLPVVRAALNDTTMVDTFFAPTNAAIEAFTSWAGFDDVERGLRELLGETRWKGYIVAYHAVPDRNLSVPDLLSLRGDDRYLEDALEGEMPLLVLGAQTGIDDDPAAADVDAGECVVVGLGSTAKIVKSERACNGYLHFVDTVLLPFDGDGELDEVQKRRLRDAKVALDARYPERPADIDPEYEDGDEAFEYSAANVPGEEDDEDDTDTDDDTDTADDDDER